MAREGDRIIGYLREARSDELSLARTLRSHIALAPRGPYRSGLRGYLRETRGHVRRVERRLAELGAGDGAFRSGARALREAGGGVLAWSRAPLKAMPGAAGEKQQLRGAQYGCATEGLVIATYTALELVAQRAGDTETARMAAEIRAEEQRMLEWLRHEILKLTDSFLRSELDALEPDDEQVERAPGQRWSRHEEVSVADVKAALSRAERERADRV